MSLQVRAVISHDLTSTGTACFDVRLQSAMLAYRRLISELSQLQSTAHGGKWTAGGLIRGKWGGDSMRWYSRSCERPMTRAQCIIIRIKILNGVWSCALKTVILNTKKYENCDRPIILHVQLITSLAWICSSFYYYVDWPIERVRLIITK